jgi:hypothetical protein
VGSVETDDLVGSAVLWVKSPARADSYGRIKLEAKEEIPCRWIDSEYQATSGNSDAKSVTATVFVDRRIELGSIMAKGTLAQLSEIPSNRDLHEVIRYTEVPDVKGRAVRRSVTLAKYNDILPDAA